MSFPSLESLGAGAVFYLPEPDDASLERIIAINKARAQKNEPPFGLVVPNADVAKRILGSGQLKGDWAPFIRLNIHEPGNAGALSAAESVMLLGQTGNLGASSLRYATQRPTDQRVAWVNVALDDLAARFFATGVRSPVFLMADNGAAVRQPTSYYFRDVSRAVTPAGQGESTAQQLANALTNQYRGSPTPAPMTIAFAGGLSITRQGFPYQHGSIYSMVIPKGNGQTVIVGALPRVEVAFEAGKLPRLHGNDERAFDAYIHNPQRIEDGKRAWQEMRRAADSMAVDRASAVADGPRAAAGARRRPHSYPAPLAPHLAMPVPSAPPMSELFPYPGLPGPSGSFFVPPLARVGASPQPTAATHWPAQFPPVAPPRSEMPPLAAPAQLPHGYRSGFSEPAQHDRAPMLPRQEDMPSTSASVRQSSPSGSASLVQASSSRVPLRADTPPPRVGCFSFGCLKGRH
ncbi:hypothetical protein [Cupriavidus necator]